MRMCHFQTQNGWFVMNKIFLVQTIITTFHLLFIVQNFKKLLQQIQSYEDASSLGPKSSFAPNNFFLKITTDIIFSYLLAPFIRQNF